jgi:hypothetical protein
MNKGVRTKMKTFEELGYDDTVIAFLNSQKESTKSIYKCNFKYILEFSGLTGEQLLESKRNDKENLWERKAVELRQWAKQKELSDSVSKGLVAILRSFFVYYRTPLIFTQAEKKKVGGRVQRTTQDYQLTNEVIAKMAFVANLREKYILLGGKSVGLRAIDFIHFTYGTFRSINLNQEAPISIGEVNTIKEGVPAHPFIDSDSLPVIKAVLEAGTAHADSEQILTFDETELSTVLQRLAEKANIQLGGKHLRFHCLRKYLCNALSSVLSESKWKQIVGKATSEGAYISDVDSTDYAKVMKQTTCINTNGNGKVSHLAEEVTSLKEQVETLTKEKTELSNTLRSALIVLAAKDRDMKKVLDTWESINHKEQREAQED